MTKVIERRAQNEDAVLFICDFSPPRGPDSELLEPARAIAADFISVAYNPGRSVRVTSALAAQWIRQDTGKDVVFTLATRDMNRVAAQSLLLGADLLGLENVVAVRGDEFTKRDLALTRAVHDFKTTELLGSIVAMNEGLDYKGLKLRSPTSFCIGATIDLGHELERETRLTRRKVEAGAQFFLLQSVYDHVPVTQFLAGYAARYGEELSAPVFCGVQVLTSEGIVFGDIPDWVTDDLEKGRPGDEIAVEIIKELVDNGFRSIYLIPPILRGGRRDYEAAQRVLEAFKG